MVKKEFTLLKKHKSDKGGLTDKGREDYNKATGGNLKAPVTSDNPKGEDKKRQDSFCSRMGGMKEQHDIDCREQPDKRICKALRRWKCL
jgi:hypothetical protein